MKWKGLSLHTSSSKARQHQVKHHQEPSVLAPRLAHATLNRSSHRSGHQQYPLEEVGARRSKHPPKLTEGNRGNSPGKRLLPSEGNPGGSGGETTGVSPSWAKPRPLAISVTASKKNIAANGANAATKSFSVSSSETHHLQISHDRLVQRVRVLQGKQEVRNAHSIIQGLTLP